MNLNQCDHWNAHAVSLWGSKKVNGISPWIYPPLTNCKDKIFRSMSFLSFVQIISGRGISLGFRYSQTNNLGTNSWYLGISLGNPYVSQEVCSQCFFLELMTIVIDFGRNRVPILKKKETYIKLCKAKDRLLENVGMFLHTFPWQPSWKLLIWHSDFFFNRQKFLVKIWKSVQSGWTLPLVSCQS